MPAMMKPYFLRNAVNIKDKAKKETGFKIIATDISEDAVDIARKNAKTAGVEHLIDFNCL